MNIIDFLPPLLLLPGGVAEYNKAKPAKSGHLVHVQEIYPLETDSHFVKSTEN